MTTGPKAQKPLKTGIKPTIEIVLPVLIAFQRKPYVPIVGNPFADIKIDSLTLKIAQGILQNVQNQVKKVLLTKQEKFSLALDIIEYCHSPEIERDGDDSPIKNYEGKATAIVRDIKERRRIRTIEMSIEEAWINLESELLEEGISEDELDNEPAETRKIGITLKADDALFLAEQMLRHYEKDYVGTSSHVIEAHDLFIDLKNESTILWDAYVSGKEDKPKEEKKSPKK